MVTAVSQAAWTPPMMTVRRPVLPVTSVVVGTDGSATAAAAVSWAAAEACRREVLLRIVSAWVMPDRPGPHSSGDPGHLAATHVQQALTQVLGRPCSPRRIACATPCEHPGTALLAAASPAGLLVLGMTGTEVMPALGRVNWYCLRRGQYPLVFVPAEPIINRNTR